MSVRKALIALLGTFAMGSVIVVSAQAIDARSSAPSEEPQSMPNPPITGLEISSVAPNLFQATADYQLIPASERRWSGPQPGEFIDFSIDIMELTTAEPDNLAGAAYAENTRYLEIYVKDPQGDVVAKVAKVLEAAGNPGKVIIVPVQYSRADLDRASALLEQFYGDGFYAGDDSSSNSIVLRTDEPQGQALYGTQTLGQLIGGEAGDLADMTILVEPIPTATAATG